MFIGIGFGLVWAPFDDEAGQGGAGGGGGLPNNARITTDGTGRITANGTQRVIAS